MSIVTTCIGAYPKPDYVKLPDWFNIPAGPDTAEPTKRWAAAMAQMGEDAEAIIARGVEQVIGDQIDAGIDIPTDGEVPRENYIHYHCRHLEGFDFDHLTEKEVRGGTYSAKLPTIRGPVSAKGRFLDADWRRAQGCCQQPVKITMPGPMTIADTNYDDYYHDPKKLGAALAAALNGEVLALAEAKAMFENAPAASEAASRQIESTDKSQRTGVSQFEGVFSTGNLQGQVDSGDNEAEQEDTEPQTEPPAGTENFNSIFTPENLKEQTDSDGQ